MCYIIICILAITKKKSAMKKFIFPTVVALFLINLLTVQYSCNNKNDDPVIIPIELEVSFPFLTLKHNQYYKIDHNSRAIEMVFNYLIDEGTVLGNIDLYDKNGSISQHYDLLVDGKVVFILFHDDFYLNGGWKYEIDILRGLKSIEGYDMGEAVKVQLRTTAKHISDAINKGKWNNGNITRTAVACISDIHCGDQRANDGNYSWFGENSAALTSFMEYVKNNENIKELVILGDLFDEWMVPYYLAPFDPSIGISNSSDYFKAISNATLNKPVFDKIREIISAGEIDVLYVPGNHDMLITQDILEEILPGIIWKSDAAGLGKYWPSDKIAMEHGHRYDFFNSPQPLVNEGQILPPGYFITRLYGSGLASRTQKSIKDATTSESDIEFSAAWALATTYVISDFKMNRDTLQMDSAKVVMSGIDGYTANMSFDGAKEMYGANIESLWPQTQVVNKVPVPLDVLLAIVNGHYLYDAALEEYIVDYSGPNQPKIVAFGHSHEPKIKVYPTEDYYTGIYANSGSWLDADQANGKKVRTFLIISPATWTGSDLDVVSLYQYNSTPSGGYSPSLVSEENIENK